MPTPREPDRLSWSMVLAVFTRPQPVTIPMVMLFAIIPFYLYIGVLTRGRIAHVPELALDRVVPMESSWSLIYLSLFLAALLPVFVVHQQELVRRTVAAFLAIWLVGDACFLAYPTAAPRHAAVVGDDFSAWALRTIHHSDVPYNCFPSLHVAQCFLAALVCYRVHRCVGAVALVWAFLVGLATLFTKQHYVADVIAGAFLAYAAYLVFLRTYPREATPEPERRLAPLLATGAAGTYGIMVAIMWLAYESSVVI